MKHTFVRLFVRWFPQTQIFQENCSVLMPFDSHGQVSLLPVISLRFLLKAWCRNHCVFHGLLQALWQLYVALGLPCLEAPKAWLEAMFALGELQRSPVLLLRASTTKLGWYSSLSTQKLPGKIFHWTVCVWAFPQVLLVCLHFPQTENSAIQPGQTVNWHLLWSTH